jgi:hypothetical protein
MSAYRQAPGRIARSAVALVLLLSSVSSVAAPLGIRAADPSVSPGQAGSPSASVPPQTMCGSLADLRLFVGYLQDQSLSEDGLVPILIGAVATLTEARALVPLVADTYRPLVEELVASVDDLIAVARAGRAGTLGSEVARLGEAITRVGVAMDALSVALQEPCPSQLPGSAEPSGLAPSPAA